MHCSVSSQKKWLLLLSSSCKCTCLPTICLHKNLLLDKIDAAMPLYHFIAGTQKKCNGRLGNTHSIPCIPYNPTGALQKEPKPLLGVAHGGVLTAGMITTGI